MSRSFAKTVLGLALIGSTLASAGCDLKKQGHHGGGDYSFTDVLVGFDYWPSLDFVSDSYDYEEYEYYEETSYEYDDSYYYYDDYYYEDYDYYDGYDYDDWGWDWKMKKAG